MDNLVLEVNKLGHTFFLKDKALKVIDEVSFKLPEGNILGILGPSGCGKSTILKCVAGLIKPDVGNILIKNITPKEAQTLKKIGFAFQEESLLNWLNIKENILLPIGIGNLDSQVPSKYEELIEIIGLRKFESFYPLELSGGMKQRVVLARALITNPEILILDEPFSAIDLLTRTRLMVEFYGIIKKLNTTTIIVTHSIEEAIFMSDELIILHDRPTKIKDELKIQFESDRNYSLFGKQEFLNIVNTCRKLLMDIL